MVNIFLSASIPQKERDAKYFETADVIAIRDAVRALATAVIPKAHLYWGGHPSITPLVRDISLQLNKDVASLRAHVTLYQSRFYEKNFPKDNLDFEDVQLIAAGPDKATSDRLMREAMLAGKKFAAGIFIGGMEGVEAEFDMFRERYRNAPVFPVASTGGGAKILFERMTKEQTQPPDPRLLTDYAYLSLLKDLLKPYADL